MTRHQYGISALVTQTSFRQGTSGDLTRRRLFSQASDLNENRLVIRDSHPPPPLPPCKQGVYFVIFPTQGPKMKGVVSTRVGILGRFFVLNKQGCS